MENPLHHFELHRIVPIEVFGIDLSINQAVIMMWLVVISVALFFILGSRRRQMIPSKFQSIVEMAVVFLRQTVLNSMGKEGLVFFAVFGDALFLYFVQ